MPVYVYMCIRMFLLVDTRHTQNTPTLLPTHRHKDVYTWTRQIRRYLDETCCACSARTNARTCIHMHHTTHILSISLTHKHTETRTRMHRGPSHRDTHTRVHRTIIDKDTYTHTNTDTRARVHVHAHRYNTHIPLAHDLTGMVVAHSPSRTWKVHEDVNCYGQMV